MTLYIFYYSLAWITANVADRIEDMLLDITGVDYYGETGPTMCSVLGQDTVHLVGAFLHQSPTSFSSPLVDAVIVVG